MTSLPATPSPPVAGLREAWRDYLTVAGGQGAALALGAATLILATRLLGPSGYGEVALFLGLLQLLYSVGVHWTMAAIIRFGRDALTRRGAAGTELGSWLALVFTAVVVTVLAAVLAARWVGGWTWAGRASTSLLVALLLAVAAAKVQEHVLQAASRMPAFVAGRLAGKVAGCLLLAALLAMLGRGGAHPVEVLAAMGAGFVVQALTVIPTLRRPPWTRPTVDPRLSLQMATYAAPLIGRSLASYLLEWMDVFWLRGFRTASEIGIYYAAYQLLIVVGEGLSAVATLAFPLLTALRARDNKMVGYGRIGAQLAVLWALLMGAIGLIAPPLMTLGFGLRFTAAGPIFALLLVAAAFQAAIYVSLPVFTSHDMTGKAALLPAAMVIANALGDLILVPRFGAMGAALATATTYGVGAVLHARLLRQVLPISIAAFILPPLLMAPALAAVAAAAPLVGVALYVVGAALVLAWARRRVFARADAGLLDSIALPTLVRRALTRMYALLG